MNPKTNVMRLLDAAGYPYHSYTYDGMNGALSGVAGFGATCLMSPVVAHIQNNGNQLFGMPIRAAQFGSVIAVIMTAVLIVYIKVALVGKKNTSGEKV